MLKPKQDNSNTNKLIMKANNYPNKAIKRNKPKKID